MKITIGGRQFDVTPAGDRVTVDGKDYAVSITWADEVPIVSVDGLPFRVEIPEERTAEMRLQVDHRPIDVRIEGALRAGPVRRPAARRASGAATTTPGAITASMTGEIVEVHVQPGDSVQAGDVVAILEAMKMRNDVTAPAAGTVERVEVTAGTRVSQGDVLIVLKEAAAER
jgi:biotin carboxyl carrier protein